MMETGQILEHVPTIQACLQHTSLPWRSSQFAAIFANRTVLLAFGAAVDWRGIKEDTEEEEGAAGCREG